MKKTTLTLIIMAAFLSAAIVTGCAKEEQAVPENSAQMENHGYGNEGHEGHSEDHAARHTDVIPNTTGSEQTACPVMGGKVNKDVFADHDGKRVYFCCNPCLEKFNADPAKYVAALEESGVILEKTTVN
ncbi:YHS domain-containing protein [Candidatus Latescibacterota bacterium]